MGASINARFKNFLFYWLPIFIYCLLIYIQSSYPSSEDIPLIPYFDKVLHFAAYAFLGGLLLRALKTLPIKDNIRLAIILSITLSSLYGISDEIHQYYVPYRNADIMDVLADILGSIFGVYIYQSGRNDF
jgi:VanZ family protein